MKVSNLGRVLLNICLEVLIVMIAFNLLLLFQRYVNYNTVEMSFISNIKDVIEPVTVFEQQLSLGFIILTLTAILSSNLKTILWTNQIEFNLKKPVFLGFIGYTSRIITNFVLTCVWIGQASDFLYVNFFIFLITLIIFMYRLISINYDQEGCRRKIIQYFDWIKKEAEKNSLQKNELEKIRQDFIVESCRFVEQNDVINFKQNILFLKERKEYETIVDILRLVSMKSLLYLSIVIDELISEEEIKKIPAAKEITKTVEEKDHLNLVLKQKCREIFGQ